MSELEGEDDIDKHVVFVDTGAMLPISEPFVRDCLGSFMQQRQVCKNLISANVSVADDYAEVDCKLKRKKDSERMKNGCF